MNGDFTSLRKLYATACDSSPLDVTQIRATMLEELSLVKVKVPSLALKEFSERFPNLMSLYLEQNDLTTIVNAGKGESEYTLSAEDDGLTVKVAGNFPIMNKLTYLKIQANPIAFINIDGPQMPRLASLQITGTALSEFKLDGIWWGLKNLHLADNRLEMFDSSQIRGMVRLSFLVLNRNPKLKLLNIYHLPANLELLEAWHCPKLQIAKPNTSLDSSFQISSLYPAVIGKQLTCKLSSHGFVLDMGLGLDSKLHMGR